MKVRSPNEVLERTESIRRNEEGDYVTFSFVSSSGVTIYRGELNKEGIVALGGSKKLRKFMDEIELGKKKVKVSKETIDKMRLALMCSEIFGK